MNFLMIIVASFTVSLFSTCKPVKTARERPLTQDTIYTRGPRSPDGTGKYYLGREISFIMGAEGAEWLERNNRQQEENTMLAISKMNLSAEAVVADIGAGTGYYSFAIAARIPKCKVYAEDVQDEMVSFLNKKKDKGKYNNVEVVKGSSQSPNLPPGSIDLAILVDVYHELEYPHEMLQAIQKSLKKNGKVLLLEYRAEDPAIEIKPHHKMTVLQAGKEMAANGFTLAYEGEFLPIQHFLLYKKAIEP